MKLELIAIMCDGTYKFDSKKRVGGNGATNTQHGDWNLIHRISTWMETIELIAAFRAFGHGEGSLVGSFSSPFQNMNHVIYNYKRSSNDVSTTAKYMAILNEDIAANYVKSANGEKVFNPLNKIKTKGEFRGGPVSNVNGTLKIDADDKEEIKEEYVRLLNSRWEMSPERIKKHKLGHWYGERGLWLTGRHDTRLN